MLQRETRDAIVNRFFGVFFLFFQTSQVMGNLISSLIFSQDTKNSTGSGGDGYACGARDCYTGKSCKTGVLPHVRAGRTGVVGASRTGVLGRLIFSSFRNKDMRTATLC